jgi:alpha-ketoglutarate-dependent 2,4-dichlorophenoxyacetate dioxygenase
MSPIKITPLHEEFGARISGIDVHDGLSPAQIEDIRAAIDTYSFVCFPDQDNSDEKQLAFTKHLGTPEANHVTLGRDGKVEYFGTVGNILEDGRKLGNDHQRSVAQTGNNMWHSDSSFRDVPSFVSLMCVYEVPDEGGETEFISARAAFGRLSAAEQARIEPLIAIHDYVFSRSKVTTVSASHAASLPPVPQKLVRSNPRTGAKNYYVGSHAKSIDGWNETDSRALLDDLLDRATGPEHVYSHSWQPGDLVIWDNRCLLHRGVGYDADKYRRYMRQTRVTGSGSTLTE